METTEATTPQPMSLRKRKSPHRRWMLGIAALVAALAVLTIATTAALSQAPSIPGFHAPWQGQTGWSGPDGLRAVIQSIDAGANTITVAGLPDRISTVKVNTVTLTAMQSDGITKPAAIGDFKAGSLVRVGFARGTGAITAIVLIPDNVAAVSGVVLASSNGVYSLATEGGLRLTVKTQANTAYTKHRGETVTAADVQVGSDIVVHGTQAPDGVTATTVRVIDATAFAHGGSWGNWMPGTHAGTSDAPTSGNAAIGREVRG